MSYAKMNKAKEPIFRRAIAELLTTNTSVSAIWRKYKVSEFLVFNLEFRSIMQEFWTALFMFLLLILSIIVSFGSSKTVVVPTGGAETKNFEF